MKSHQVSPQSELLRMRGFKLETAHGMSSLKHALQDALTLESSETQDLVQSRLLVLHCVCRSTKDPDQ